jgi:hypothetical protein
MEIKDQGYLMENNKNMFIHIDDTIPRLKWLSMSSDNIPKIKWLNEGDDCKSYSICWNYHLNGMRNKIKKTADLLYETYLSKYDNCYENKKLIYSYIWNGACDGSSSWHNDLKEGANVFFLLYFTDMEQGVGGEIMFRNMTQNKKVTCYHLPKKYDLILGSQDLNFQHRVEDFRKPNVQRITMNFGFNIKNSPWT